MIKLFTIYTNNPEYEFQRLAHRIEENFSILEETIEKLEKRIIQLEKKEAVEKLNKAFEELGWK